MKKTKKGRAAHLREAEQKSGTLERQVGELKKRAETAEYELGRYRKAVDTRNKIIADQKERLKLEEMKYQSYVALVTLLLCSMGADEEHPFVVEHRSVREALNGYRLLVKADEEEQTFAMSFVMDEME